MPQAWAAGSVFLMLQASLGLSIDALAGTIRIDRPCLPSGLDRLTVAGLAVGETRLDLTFQRAGKSGRRSGRAITAGRPMELDVAD